MEYLFFYCLQLFDRLDSLNFFIGLILILLCLVFCGVKLIAICTLCDKDEKEEYALIATTLKKIITGFFVVSILIFFIPTKQTLLFFGGVYLGKNAIKQIATSEKLKKLDTIINLELDNRIKELSNAR